MKRLKNSLPILLIVLTVSIGLYFLITLYKLDRIDETLNEQASYLEFSYKQGLDRFNVIGENIYLSLQNDKEFINILANTTESNIDASHEKMYQHLKDEFHRLKLSGVMGLHILSPNNVSILRMHKPGKYGDDLSSIRPMIKTVNEEKIHLHGFEEGKSSHAFREAFPVYKSGRYIGVIEVLFSSTKLQDYTMRASNIHTHFIVNRNVFKTNEWKSKTSEPYEQSIEHEDFLFSFNDHINHATLDISKKTIIAPLREEINAGIESGKSFEVFQTFKGTAKIVAFYPVKRFVDAKPVAYIVSYTSSDKLYNMLENINILNIILVVSTIFIYFIIIRLVAKNEDMIHELKYDALTNVYNRKYFMNYIHEAYKSSNKDFSIVMVDIDFFKNVNDTYGHQYGDLVLKDFARILKTSFRSMDIVARYGGEEFIVLIHTNAQNSYNITQEIRKKVEAYEFGEESIKLTSSFGIAEFQDDSSVENIINRADAALYKAKENGRNQVQIG